MARTSSFILIAMICAMQVLWAAPGYGQGNEKKLISLSYTNTPIEKVFSAIEKKADVIIMYEKTAAIKDEKVSLSVSDKSVAAVMDLLLKDLSMQWSIRGKFIRIENMEKPATAFELVGDPQVTVKGKVTDSLGNPIQGASIRLTPGNKGAFSGADGIFSIANVPSGSYTLEISCVGFETVKRKIIVAEDSSFDIVLQVSSSTLNEVVVNKGYYTEKKNLSTGSVVSISSKEIQNQPVTSPLLALQGRVAGLEVTPTNGAPGTAPRIKIRGSNSLRFDGGYPLFVVDGIIVDPRPLESQSSVYYAGIDPLAGMDPENIESVEVLKDADATSIYGSRGANGVILIKTKTRTSNAPFDIDVNAYHGMSEMPRFLKMLNTQQYLEMRKEAFKNAGQQPRQNDYDLMRWDSAKYTDWQRELVGGTANVNDVQLALSGGNERTSFRLNGGYHKETTIVSDDFGYRSVTAGMTLHHRSSDQRLNISTVANYIRNENNYLNVSSFLEAAIKMAPNTPDLYNEDGSLNWDPIYNPISNTTRYAVVNPMAELLKTNETTTGTLFTNGTVSYLLTKGLVVKTSIGYTEVHGDELLKDPIQAKSPAASGPGATGIAFFGSNKRSSWIIEPQATYDFKVSDHQFNFLVGSTFQESRSHYLAIGAYGYSSDVLLNSLRGATTYNYTADNKSEYRYTALFVRLGYNWHEKYLVNLTGRRDGSSRFGPGKQFGNFAALGAAWIFSAEKFMEGISNVLSFGKLRGSYGTTGNDQIQDYKFYNLYELGERNYQNTTTLLPKGLFNSDFNWEVTRKLELALEMRFLKDRLSLQANWYRNRSSNQVVDYPLPGTTGFQSISKNFDATVENKGWELMLSSQHINTANFSWSTSINLTASRNKLVAFDGIEESPYATEYKVGEPLSVQKRYIWTGVDPQTGLHTIVDLNKNGYIDEKDRILTNPLAPEYFGGLQNAFRYKGFELTCLFHFSKQKGTGPYYTYPGLTRTNEPVQVMSRWRKEGDVTSVAKFSTDFMLSNSYLEVLNSTYNDVDASFIRLKNLSLAYTFSGNFLRKCRIKEARFFAQGQNLFVISDFIGLDPETGARTLPQLRSISGGINLKF